MVTTGITKRIELNLDNDQIKLDCKTDDNSQSNEAEMTNNNTWRRNKTDERVITVQRKLRIPPIAIGKGNNITTLLEELGAIVDEKALGRMVGGQLKIF
ncbi:hypothetical protein NPIL_15941 [Nephila pilipes]|uniref:Uncharacterized protein n=1 Tax=Nephila pilipes TaxID=299642 RepID=A0A8X6QKZ5_NEPPI|nr:hypothetical protein NPIL_15941 [Nephila pilipes]